MIRFSSKVETCMRCPCDQHCVSLRQHKFCCQSIKIINNNYFVFKCKCKLDFICSQYQIYASNTLIKVQPYGVLLVPNHIQQSVGVLVDRMLTCPPPHWYTLYSNLGGMVTPYPLIEI